MTATHVSGTLVAPAALYPGGSTPATAGETITLYVAGGEPVQAAYNGLSTQTGTLITIQR